MRYQLLKPPSPFDIRSHEFKSVDGLLILAPVVDGCDALEENEAVSAVRSRFPDAVGLPVPARVGSGTIWLLAFLEDVHERTLSAEDRLPFVAFVRPIPENGKDRARIQQHQWCDPKKWRPPAKRARASTALVHPVELRGTSLSSPVSAHAEIGIGRDGRPVIYLDMGGEQMSIELLRAVDIRVADDTEVTDPPRKVVPDVGIGSSFDPKPW